mmetsp:Transcript_11306/g.24471  ORF Transcript_11306/g.24471 Transcript_11306/m.24471 type:complete len:262 (-) Transcript_11306:185-970(-)|eukprot:CAMPEP_0206549442 /NCGR_PEP_ID=MMETSP0325_2-20121206/14467_1 /ASSEMBLY_ACC=CAM_ASM_000347 /TAXON_ID=2866 /ORGANISM="Crypthecodinium cohnii, Strain Seligo" /LENGTH=261 /DNA_ID=CAMNT_0054049085 /DNA_START=142 /DNA_END=927 /DNA_ORIENTATION=-
MGCCESSATSVIQQQTEADGAWDVKNSKVLVTLGLRGQGHGCSSHCAGPSCGGSASKGPLKKGLNAGLQKPAPSCEPNQPESSNQSTQASPTSDTPTSTSETRSTATSRGTLPAPSWASRQGVKTELARLQYREVTPEDYELLCLLDDEVPKKGRKTPEAFLAQLPRSRASDNAVVECQICLMSIAPDDEIIRLPCQHIAFHPECISQWLTHYSGVCPLCQVAVEPALTPPGSISEHEPGSRQVHEDAVNCDEEVIRLSTV